jgi:hypothetical protein
MYKDFIENLNDRKKTLEIKGAESLEEKLVFQMKKVWHLKEDLDTEVLKKFEQRASSDIERSRILELQMMDSLNKGSNVTDIKEIAKKALDLNSESAFSRMILSRNSFMQNNIGNGIDYLLQIETYFPGAKWIYLEMARMILYAGSARIPSSYLWQIPSFELRVIYFITLKVILPFYFLILTFYTLWISFLSAYFPIFVILTPLSVVFSYAVLRGEKILYSWYGSWIFWLIVSTGLVFYVFR